MLLLFLFFSFFLQTVMDWFILRIFISTWFILRKL